MWQVVVAFMDSDNEYQDISYVSPTLESIPTIVNSEMEYIKASGGEFIQAYILEAKKGEEE